MQKLQKRIQPATIREIAGVYDFHAKTALDRMKSFFFLLLPFPLTKQAHRQFDTSPVPLLHLKIPSSPVEYVDEDDESVESFGEPAPIYINQKLANFYEVLKPKSSNFSIFQNINVQSLLFSLYLYALLAQISSFKRMVGPPQSWWSKRWTQLW